MGTQQNIYLKDYDPIQCVFLRTLAWRAHNNDRKLTVSDLVDEHLQNVRDELTLPKLLGGANQNFINTLRKPGLLIEEIDRDNIKKNAKFLVVSKKIQKNWRLCYLPSHNIVRRLSSKSKAGIVYNNEDDQTFKEHIELRIFLRTPELPELEVYIGKNMPNSSTDGKKGIYFIREKNGLYIGQTDELPTRFHTHFDGGRKPLWWVFFVPKNSEALALDSMRAAESLLIAFWNEICRMTNKNCGLDREPHFSFLQQGVILTQSVSAAMIYLILHSNLQRMVSDRSVKKDDWSLPFKSLGTRKINKRGWPQCYLEKLNDSD